jgi:hypothetical protein
MMNHPSAEHRSPLAILRTTNKKPAANQLHMLEQLEQFDVRAAMAGPDRIDVASGEVLHGEGIFQSIGSAAIQAGETADALRIIKRLPASLRSSEADIPHINPDAAFKRTVDKLHMSEVCGDLAVPTRLLIAKNISAERSHEILYTAAKEWGDALIIKTRSDQSDKNVEVGNTAELSLLLNNLRQVEGQPNFIVQPYLDSRPAHKPYLPESLQDRPSSLRVVAGAVKMPGMQTVAEIYTAFYRYAPSATDTVHDSETDNNFYLQQQGVSIEESHPELASCFELVKETLKRELDASESVSHGIATQFGSTDLLILPPDVTYGHSFGDNTEYKAIVMEQNSGSSRFDAGKHDPTRNAWHVGEARLIASLAHGELLQGGRV